MKITVKNGIRSLVIVPSTDIDENDKAVILRGISKILSFDSTVSSKKSQRTTKAKVRK
jgi:hypothetical protein